MKSLEQALEAAGMPGKVDQSMHVKLTQAERDILSILSRDYKMKMNIVIRRLIVQAAIDKVQDNEVFALIATSDAGVNQ